MGKPLKDLSFEDFLIYRRLEQMLVTMRSGADVNHQERQDLIKQLIG